MASIVLSKFIKVGSFTYSLTKGLMVLNNTPVILVSPHPNFTHYANFTGGMCVSYALSYHNNVCCVQRCYIAVILTFLSSSSQCYDIHVSLIDGHKSEFSKLVFTPK